MELFFGADIVTSCPSALLIIPIPVEAKKEIAMLNTKIVGAVAIIAATAFSSTAIASDRTVNTAVGAVAGAMIGSSTHHRNGALAGAVIGAAVGSSLSSNNNRSYNDGYYDNRSGYYNSGYDNVRAVAYLL
jgi:hypothetical protein